MFWLEGKGLCDKCQKIVEEKEVCKFYIPPNTEKAITIQSIDIAIEDIKVLQYIYK